MPIVLPLDDAERVMRTTCRIDRIRSIMLCVGDVQRAYSVGELCLFVEDGVAYLDRCVGHSPDYRSWYFRTLAVFG
jgi:hypothetical protein